MNTRQIWKSTNYTICRFLHAELWHDVLLELNCRNSSQDSNLLPQWNQQVWSWSRKLSRFRVRQQQCMTGKTAFNAWKHMCLRVHLPCYLPSDTQSGIWRVHHVQVTKHMSEASHHWFETQRICHYNSKRGVTVDWRKGLMPSKNHHQVWKQAAES